LAPEEVARQLAILLFAFDAGAELFRTGWFVESLLTELVIALVVRTRRRFYQSRPGALLLWSSLALIVITVAIPALPGASALGFVPLPAALVLALIAVTALYIVSVEGAKILLYRRAT
jgi:Mg2+-importing ATPase